MVTVTLDEGADDSASPTVAVDPWVTCTLDGVATTDPGELPPPPPLVDPAGVQVTEAGAELVPIWVDAPAARFPFQEALATVTVSPDCDQFPDQPWVSCCLPEYEYDSVHPVIAVLPVLVTVIEAVNPVPQSVCTL